MAAEETRERQLTREALYELVWSEPMQVLGPRFGVSDVGLKKRSEEHTSELQSPI